MIAIMRGQRVSVVSWHSSKSDTIAIAANDNADSRQARVSGATAQKSAASCRTQQSRSCRAGPGRPQHVYALGAYQGRDALWAVDLTAQHEHRLACSSDQADVGGDGKRHKSLWFTAGLPNDVAKSMASALQRANKRQELIVLKCASDLGDTSERVDLLSARDEGIERLPACEGAGQELTAWRIRGAPQSRSS